MRMSFRSFFGASMVTLFLTMLAIFFASPTSASSVHNVGQMKSNSPTAGALVGVKVNFQPSGRYRPPGYLIDTGGLKTAHGTWNYGWNMNLSANSRDRSVNKDQRLDTFVYYVASTADWSINVPNGRYLIKVAMGDASFTHSEQLYVEGSLWWDVNNMAPDTYKIGSQYVNINDGDVSLTIRGRLNYVEIIPAPLSGTAYLDWGDAPNGYHTSLSNNGPRHTYVEGLYLGGAYDDDGNGWMGSSNADNDDVTNVDDEDAVDTSDFFGFSTADAKNKRRWVVGVTNKTGSAAKLYGWIDFDHNGSFDADEFASANVPAGAYAVHLLWQVPADITAGDTYMRLRITSDTLTHTGGSSDPDERAMGPASDGEVEDYKINIRDFGDGDERCPDKFYQTRAPRSGAHYRFNALDFSTNPIQEDSINSASSPKVQDLVRDPDHLNAIGYSPSDGYLYGIYWHVANSDLDYPTVLVRINPNTGALQKLGYLSSYGNNVIHHQYEDISYQNGDLLWDGSSSGDIDASSSGSRFLYTTSSSWRTLLKINVRNQGWSSIDLRDASGNPTPFDSYDFAFNRQDQKIYAMRERPNSTYSDLATIDPATGVLTTKTLNGHLPNKQGGAVMDLNGQLYGLVNRGPNRRDPFRVYSSKVHDANPKLVYLGNGSEPTRSNDAAGCLIARDWGDLPDSYDTLKSSNGPRNGLLDADNDGVLDLYLGDNIDSDRDGFVDGIDDKGNALDDDQPLDPNQQTTANGADEDGITKVTPLIPGHKTCYHVKMYNSQQNQGFLTFWVDFNGDGNFGDASAGQVDPNEYHYHNLGTSVHYEGDRCFSVPASATWANGKAAMRFRLSNYASSMTQWGGALMNGEVEDYMFDLACVGNYVWNDTTGTSLGVQDSNDTPISGLKVRLVWAGPDGTIDTDANDPLLNDDRVYTTTTTSAGKYQFCGLLPGTYRVEIPNVPSDLKSAVSPNTGSDDALDSDGVQSSSGNPVDGPDFTIPDPISLTANDNAANDTDPTGFADDHTDLSFDFGFTNIDWGDAPDGYATDKTDNSGEGVGPSHTQKVGLYLGSKFDNDANGQPSANADGDDTHGIDDEDGVDIANQYEFSNADAGFTRRWSISVTVTSTTTANLYGWVDFDRNGTFDADEIAMTTVGQNATTATLAWVVPADVTAGTSYARFRITTDNLTHSGGSSAPDERARGAASNGEVEDYKITIRDFGAGGTPNTCDDSYYQTRADGPSANYHFVKLNLDYDPIQETEKNTGPSPKIQDIANNQYGVNAMGYNLVDGFIYAVMWKVSEPLPRHVLLIRINPNTGGYQIMGEVLADADYTFQGNDLVQGSPLVAQNDLDAGDLNRSNHLYLGSSGTSDLANVDIKAMTFSVVPITLNGSSANIGAGDFSYNPLDGKLYLARSTNVNQTKELATIDPATGVMTVKTMRDTFPSGQGGAVFDESGHLYPMANQSGSGYRLYRIDVSKSTPILGFIGSGGSNATYSDAAGCKIGRDFGDLPSSFVTKRYFDGPRHDLIDKNRNGVMDLYMGNTIDADTDGFVDRTDDSNGMATDDDEPVDLSTLNDQANGADEDGITQITPLIAGKQACFHLKAHNETGKTANLYTWWDFNGDGNFGSGSTPDPNEFQQFAVGGDGNYDQDYCFIVPSGATFNGGKVGIRFRLTTDTLTSSSWGGGASDGEVEDYRFKLACLGNYVWDDTNGSVEDVQDSQDSHDKIITMRLVWGGPDNTIDTDASDSTKKNDDRIYTVSPSTTTGIYQFCGLLAGTYRIEAPTPPQGAPQAVTPNVGSAALDSDGVQSNGIGGPVDGPDIVIPSSVDLSSAPDTAGNDTDPNNYPDSQTDLSIDFGFQKADRVAIGNRVWNDVDNDGVFDTTLLAGPNAPQAETGIDGAKLNLYKDSDGDGQCEPGSDTFITTTTTSGGGFYQFKDLTPSVSNDAKTNYCVALDSSSVKPTYTSSSSGGGGNPDAADNNDDGIPAGSFIITKPFAALFKGQTTSDSGDPAGYFDTSSYMTVDFGLNTDPNAISMNQIEVTSSTATWLLALLVIFLSALIVFIWRWHQGSSTRS